MDELERELHDLAATTLGRPLTTAESNVIRAGVAFQAAAAALPFDVAAALIRLFD